MDHQSVDLQMELHGMDLIATALSEGFPNEIISVHPMALINKEPNVQAPSLVPGFCSQIWLFK